MRLVAWLILLVFACVEYERILRVNEKVLPASGHQAEPAVVRYLVHKIVAKAAVENFFKASPVELNERLLLVTDAIFHQDFSQGSITLEHHPPRAPKVSRADLRYLGPPPCDRCLRSLPWTFIHQEHPRCVGRSSTLAGEYEHRASVVASHQRNHTCSLTSSLSFFCL